LLENSRPQKVNIPDIYKDIFLLYLRTDT